jgi:hypothetical protein
MVIYGSGWDVSGGRRMWRRKTTMKASEANFFDRWWIIGGTGLIGSPLSNT